DEGFGTAQLGREAVDGHVKSRAVGVGRGCTAFIWLGEQTVGFRSSLWVCFVFTGEGFIGVLRPRCLEWTVWQKNEEAENHDEWQECTG
ncbi:hypothetical protein, partial [Klebsiella quasipneumoniae]|uniref:hypothetical protein n=1 Tax=Klebsiella quasipneumoniae TaxID=1463165 RepID=UPI003D3625B7